MDAQLLHTTLRRHRRHFLAFFSALTRGDYETALAGQGETLLDLLRLRYGYTTSEARGAWNEFVLRHVDGRVAECTRRHTARRRALRSRCRPTRSLPRGQ